MNQSRAKQIFTQCERWARLLWTRTEKFVCDLKAEFAVTKEPVPWAEREKLTYYTVCTGEVWSSTLFDCAWAHITGTIPQGEHLAFKFDSDGEGLVYNGKGNPVRGITNFCCTDGYSFGKPEKLYVSLKELDCANGKADFWVDVANNDPFGNLLSGKLKACEIVQRDPENVALYYDFTYLYRLAKALEECPQRNFLLYLLEETGLCLHANMTVQEVSQAREMLQKGIVPGANPFFTLYAIGHAHLDLAWLWPIRETRRKAARTLCTALSNLEKYPSYRFGVSQPQQLAWLKQDYPEVYKRVKEQIAKGKIEPQGAMWVECDTNLPCGESLIRQIAYGTKFWREEFSVEPKNVWLPDVFGFSASLPQIMKGCELDYFLTIKLGWNEVNRFPYHTFRWRGNDGSEVLAHIPPEEDYNSFASPGSVMKAQKNYRESGLCDKALMLYGIGDGGGGPGEEHLEVLKRSGDIYGLPGVVNARAGEFFAELAKDCSRYPVYCGELYLEKHQGTYTSQAKNKYYNYVLENELCFLEAIAASENTAFGAEVDEIWKEMLLYQFHDVLPGSAIARVYQESIACYVKLLENVLALQKKCTERSQGALCAYNATSFERKEIVEHRGKRYVCEAKPFAFSALNPCADSCTVRMEGLTLGNEHLVAVFGQEGVLRSLKLKKDGREYLGEELRLVLYCDEGDAWDMYQSYYVAEGAILRADKVIPIEGVNYKGLRFHYSFGVSELVLECKLKENSPCLEFEAMCDWRERNRMLRAEYAPNVAAREASFGVQYGYVRRSMTENTEFETARYEVCGQKFADVSERGHGLSVFCKGKYGYRAKGNTVSVNLLRSQNYPCVGQDDGRQAFMFALYPHTGDLETGGVYREAYLYHRPLKVFPARETVSLAQTDNGQIAVDWVKRAECGKGYVVRTFNTGACEADCALFVNGEVFETDMLERNARKVQPSALHYKSFEVKTFLVKAE